MVIESRRLQNIFRLQRESKLFTSTKYTGWGSMPPTGLAELEDQMTSGLFQTKAEQRAIKSEIARFNRLGSPYRKVAEKELARVAVEDFVKSIENVPAFTKVQQYNREKIIKEVKSYTDEQRLDFLKYRYQDPRTFTRARYKSGERWVTPEQQAQKALGGNGYMKQLVFDDISKVKTRFSHRG